MGATGGWLVPPSAIRRGIPFNASEWPDKYAVAENARGWGRDPVGPRPGGAIWRRLPERHRTRTKAPTGQVPGEASERSGRRGKGHIRLSAAAPALSRPLAEPRPQANR